MSAARNLSFKLLTAFTFMTMACFVAASVARAGDASADAAKRRAESERRSREMKARADARRKEVEAHQREVRARLKLPDPAAGGTGSVAAKGALTKPLPTHEELLKKLKLPEGRSFSKSSPSDRKKSPVEYSPKRGQEFAFLVEMVTREGGLDKQWIGTPYFAGVFSDVQSSFAEMFCIGNLSCRIRSSPKRPWTAVSVEGIELPQKFMFGSHGVLNTRTTSLFDEHTLPFQLSAILPLEELIFPELPPFGDSAPDESRKEDTFYLRGGQKNILGDTPTKSLNGESTRVRRVENETSATPRIVNEKSFSCPSQEISLSFRQTGNFDAKEGMILDSEIDYRLELDEKVRMVVKVRRLYGDELVAARTAALKILPASRWPAYFRRIPADYDNFQILIPRSPEEIPRGQRVSVSLEISERDAHGSRRYLAQTIGPTRDGNVRVRLEGSGEEIDVSHISVRLPKG